jgi:hypothetical protein
MNRKDAAKLLNLIKLSYPSAYRDMDDEWKLATINMWAMSFPDVPYPIVEQAFNHYRMGHKFPPTVAEMVEELRKVYYQAQEGALVNKGLGNEEMVLRFREVMAYTSRYKDEDLGGLNISSLPRMMGGNYHSEEIGSAHYGLHSGPEGRNELRKMEGPPSSY